MRSSMTILAFFFSLNFALSQSVTLDRTLSKLSVKGTSTLHDWESDVEDFNCTAEINDNRISQITFSAKVNSIKSGKSGMDKNTYVAMKASDHPTIKLSASDLVFVGGKISGSAKLTIAGVTKDISLALTSNSKGNLKVSGEIPLKMTMFDIDPPVAVFGTITTGDDITIALDFTFKTN